MPGVLPVTLWRGGREAGSHSAAQLTETLCMWLSTSCLRADTPWGLLRRAGQQQQGQHRWFATKIMTDRLEGFVNKHQGKLQEQVEKLSKNFGGKGQQGPGGGRDGGVDPQQPRGGGGSNAAPGQFSA